jgi:putative ABC transport system permease protein
MIKNYFKTAWRNLWKNKVYSIINVGGLSIGMAACIVILLFVFYERSFDNIHKKNIYRLNEVQKFEGMAATQKVALSMFPMGPTLKNDFPEIRNFTRIHWEEKDLMSFQEKRVFLPELFFVDSTFLGIFDFRLLEGNRETALQQPNSIILTASAARKIFGNQDPLGKTVTRFGNDTLHLSVTGVLEDVPENSQLQFDGLISFSTIYSRDPDMVNNWGGNWLDTYLELAPGTNQKKLESKFPAYLKQHMARDNNWKMYELFLLPLRDVHANAADIGLDYLNFQKFDKNYTRIFFIIALIVLVIACVNFMNLSTARSAERAREVGVRKSIGAQRFQLAGQFLSETILLSLIALLLAIGLVELSLPYINRLSQRNLSLPLFSHPEILLSILGGTIAVGVLSGLYPAAYLSSFQPVKVLKGGMLTGNSKSMLRNSLVICQFSIAIFLMISTLFVVKQLDFMQKKDPGFVRDQVLTIPLDALTYSKYELIKKELLQSSLISSVTAAQDQLGSHLDQSSIQFKGDGPMRNLTSTRLIVDPDYLRLYQIALVLGNNFSTDKSANGREYIINESLAKELLKDNVHSPMSSLIGKNFGFDSLGFLLGVIVGIAKDFNFNSLHYKMETMFMFNEKDYGFNTVSVKINGAKPSEAISYIQSVWKHLFPDHPFEYQFLDAHFEELYRADSQVSRIVSILAALAIIISCLGLFGLASYSAEKRIREIGIRKVMGASVQSLVALLSLQFIGLVVIANLIAWPLAWIGLREWMQDYAYHISINLWIFLVAGLVAVLIALFTVSFQALKAAVANPVNSLRTE